MAMMNGNRHPLEVIKGFREMEEKRKARNHQHLDLVEVRQLIQAEAFKAMEKKCKIYEAELEAAFEKILEEELQMQQKVQEMLEQKTKQSIQNLELELAEKDKRLDNLIEKEAQRRQEEELQRVSQEEIRGPVVREDANKCKIVISVIVLLLLGGVLGALACRYGPIKRWLGADELSTTVNQEIRATRLLELEEMSSLAKTVEKKVIEGLLSEKLKDLSVKTVIVLKTKGDENTQSRRRRCAEATHIY